MGTGVRRLDIGLRLMVEQTSELQSVECVWYAGFGWKRKSQKTNNGIGKRRTASTENKIRNGGKY